MLLRLCHSLLILLASNLPLTAASQTPGSLQPGQTAYQQAQQLWQQQQAKVVTEHYANAQESFLSSKPENIPNRRVIRTTLSEWPIDGARMVRLGFFDDQLYQLDLEYAPGQGERLLHALQQQYGTLPVTALNSNNWQWQHAGLHVLLRGQPDGSLSLRWEHQLLARKVAASHAEVYAAHIRQRTRLITSP
ncbi:MAG: hypothetical protein ACK4FZ_12280 [Vogesella sp.]|uniref:hypothetical protein n=1 Tax=Vogesella sp. TaxID=1904252 RepID=UPI003919CD5E